MGSDVTRRSAMHLLYAGALASCAVPVVPAPEGMDALLARTAAWPRPARLPGRDAVFAVTGEMQAYVDTVVRPQARRLGPVEGLYAAVYARNQLQLSYRTDYTRNAAEAFRDRAGNCMSLVIMTAALAWQLGLGVQFRHVPLEGQWARSRGMLQLIGHVNVSISEPAAGHRLGLTDGAVTIDFIVVPPQARDRAKPVSEQRLVAMYMNNRAAEQLAAGDEVASLGWLLAGLDADPSHAGLYVTLGVLSYRKGDLDTALAACEAALFHDPLNIAALVNRYDLLVAVGRGGDAARWRERFASIIEADPGRAYAAALAQLAAGDTASALAMLGRVSELLDDDREVRFALGLAQTLAGQPDQAARTFERAALAMPEMAGRLTTQTAFSKLEALRSKLGTGALN